MDCCDWTGTGYFRSAAQLPQGLQTVPNITALRALTMSTAQNGLLVWVRSLHDAFEYQSDSSLPTDNITIVQPTSGPGRWLRLKFPNEHWARQVSWFISATTGNDENAGSTAGSALKTHAEFSRRVNGMKLGQQTTVTLLTDLPEQLRLDFALPDRYIFPSLTYRGTPTTLRAGVLSNPITPVNGPANTPMSVTDASIADWTPFVGERIRMTSGARVGAIAWIAKATGGTSVRTSPFINSEGTLVTPAAGDSYVIERLTVTSGIDLNVRGISINAHQVKVADLTFDPLAIPSAVVGGISFRSMRNGNITMFDVENCKLGGHVAFSGAIFSNCRFAWGGPPPKLSGCYAELVGGISLDTLMQADDGLKLVIKNHFLFQGQGPGLISNANVELRDGTGFFDMTSTALILYGPSSVMDYGLIYGSGNGSLVVQANANTFYGYTTKPQAISTHSTPVMVGGPTFTYADLPKKNDDNNAWVVSIA